MVKLSIITTLYKSESYLKKCLDSLLTQDLSPQDYEIVIVDDGSPDACADIVKEYQRSHDNITLIQQENMGLPGARNTGMANAYGKYVTFVDPDDFINQNVYGDLIRKMENESLDMLRFNYTLTEEDTYRPLAKYKESVLTVDYRDVVTDGENFLGERLGYSCFVWQFLFRRSLFDDSGIAFREKVFDDSDLLPRVLMKAKRVTSVDANVYNYVLRSSSLVNSVSPDAVKRKVSGMLYIIKMYNEYYQTCSLQSSRIWFRSMVSSTYLCMLQQLAKYLFDSKQKYLEEFKAVNKIHFCYKRRIFSKRLHMLFASFFPLMYMSFYKKMF